MIDHDLRAVVEAVDTMQTYIFELEKLVLKLEGKSKGDLNYSKRRVHTCSLLYHSTCTGDPQCSLKYPEALEDTENAES